MIRTDIDDRVLRITIERPEKKNALTEAMYADLAAAFALADRAGIRAVLLTGSGGTFTAGNDLTDFVANPPQDLSAPVYRFLETISQCPKPIVAAVEGVAVGIGTTLLLHCDLVYAAADTRFQLPFVNLGLCPEAAVSYLLPLAVGLPRATEWLLLGEPFSAEEAAAAGLVTAVLPPDSLLAHAEERARALAAKPPESVRLTRQLLRAGHARAVAETMRTEAGHILERLRSEEVAEAVQAFFDKRQPDFSRFD